MRRRGQEIDRISLWYLLLATLGGTCFTYSRLHSYVTLAVLPAYACAPQPLALAQNRALLGYLSPSSRRPRLGSSVRPVLKESKPPEPDTAELELWFQASSRGKGGPVEILYLMTCPLRIEEAIFPT